MTTFATTRSICPDCGAAIDPGDRVDRDCHARCLALPARERRRLAKSAPAPSAEAAPISIALDLGGDRPDLDGEIGAAIWIAGATWAVVVWEHRAWRSGHWVLELRCRPCAAA